MTQADARTGTRAIEESRARLRAIIARRSLLSGGDFTLASGKKSPFFFDMKKTMFDPEGINLIAEIVYDLIRDEGDVTAVGGLEMGAVPIALAVAMRSRRERPVQAFFVRKAPKGHGTNNLIDGNLTPGATVVLFEDVTTTGGSATRAVEAVRAQGCKIKKLVTLVDRREGAQAVFAAQGIAFQPVFTLKDFGG